MNKIQHIAIIRDHSGSMGHITRAAMADYNTTITGIKDASNSAGFKTYITTVKCGDRYAPVEVETQSLDINLVPTLYTYGAHGGTPLFDSVGRAIEILERSKVFDTNGQIDQSFLVLAITDGEENQSYTWKKHNLKAKFQELEATGEWTFAFRVPKGSYKAALHRDFGISLDNILEWEATTRGVEEATVATASSFNTYYAQRSRGVKASSAFFTNLNVTKAQVDRSSLKNISLQLQTLRVLNGVEGARIDNFMVTKTGHPYDKGTAFYQLVKPEYINDDKGVIIRHKQGRECYSGAEARDMLGLPKLGKVRVRPGQHGDWDVFVQSRSDNRILPVNTEVLFWANAPR